MDGYFNIYDKLKTRLRQPGGECEIGSLLLKIAGIPVEKKT
jgi:hypothetical protein